MPSPSYRSLAPLSSRLGPLVPIPSLEGMAATTEKTNLASFKRPGDKGSIKVSKSGKYQPQLFVKELNKQRALGSFETAEEAAEVLAEANNKMNRKGGSLGRTSVKNVLEEAGPAWHGALPSRF